MPIGQDREVEEQEPVQGSEAGATVQLGADYLSYARQRFDAQDFKNALVERLLPTVPRRDEPPAIVPGEPFGKFHIVDKLGKGGMAEVYLALDPERGQQPGPGSRERREQVAIKVMKPEIVINPEYVRRFLREAANTALIDHPNVVRVHEVGSVAGRLYFTMELIEGRTLKAHLKKGPVSEEEGVQILCQLVDGLVAAHERGIGHRDLKPSNIMLVTDQARFGFEIEGDFDVCVKVTDFGLAHQLSLDKSEVMAEGRFLGTAKYVAPEVVKGQKATLKSDVFSLGVLAFQMFAGKAPFRARNKIEYITANLNDTAPLLHTRVRVSNELSRLVDAMLEKDPVTRPDVAGLRRDLGRLAARSGREPVHAPDDPSSIFHDAEGPSWSQRFAEMLPESPLPSDLKPLLTGVGGLVALIVVGTLIYRLGFSSAPVAPTPPLPPPPVHESPTQPVVDKTVQPRIARKTLPPPKALPPAKAGSDALARDVTLPPTSAFRDQLARSAFSSAVQQGDDAWRRGAQRKALDAWGRARALTSVSLPALHTRISLAKYGIALASGQEAERAGELRRARGIYASALKVRPGDAELEQRLARVDGLLAKHKQLDEGLRRARDLAFNPARKAEAAKALEGLRALARELRRDDEVRAALKKLGRRSGARGPLTAAQRRLLQQVETLLRQRSWDAAKLAIKRARERIGDVAQVQALEQRLARGKNTPRGRLYVEMPAAYAGALPRGFYVRSKPVTNREYLAWFREATRQQSVVPPSSWGGNSAPPKGREDDAVRGVRLAEARKFAESLAERLPTAAERKVIDRHLTRNLKKPLEPEKGGRFPRGFRTLKDAR